MIRGEAHPQRCSQDSVSKEKSLKRQVSIPVFFYFFFFLCRNDLNPRAKGGRERKKRERILRASSLGVRGSVAFEVSRRPHSHPSGFKCNHGSLKTSSFTFDLCGADRWRTIITGITILGIHRLLSARGFAVHSVAAEPPAKRALAMAASATENREKLQEFVLGQNANTATLSSFVNWLLILALWMGGISPTCKEDSSSIGFSVFN